MTIRNEPNAPRATTRPLTAPGTKPLAQSAVEGFKKQGVLGNLKDVFVGGGEAIADMGKGLFTMVRHPIQTAKGLGFLFAKLVTHPREGLSMLGHAFVDPYLQAVRDGHPGQALGRGIVEIGSMFITPGDVAGAAKATVTGATGAMNAMRAGSGVTQAVKAGSLAVHLTDQSAELAEKAGRLAVMGYAAEAKKLGQVAKFTDKIADMAKGGDVARATRYMNTVANLQHLDVGGQMISMQALLQRSDLLLDAGNQAAHAASAAGRLEAETSQAQQASQVVPRAAMLDGVAARGVVDSLPSFERMMQVASKVAVESPFVLLSPQVAVSMGFLQNVLPDAKQVGQLTPEKIQQLSQQYNLAPDAANVQKFLAEVGQYDQDAVGPGQGSPAQVRQVQAALRVAGYDVQPSGVYDEATALAVMHFKQKEGLHQSYKQADGTFAVNQYVDQATANALYNVVQAVGTQPAAQSEAPKPATGLTDAQVQDLAGKYNLLPDAANVAAFEKEAATYSNAVGPDSSATDVGRIQTVLSRLGYSVQPTGTFDDATANAIMAFKAKMGIHQTYKMPNGDWAINEYVDPTTELRMRAALAKA